MNLILLNISASIMILTTLFIHKIFKKHVPHDIFCILWLVIILRLFFPIKLETRLSLWNLIIKSEHVVADFTNLPISHGYTTIADFVQNNSFVITPIYKIIWCTVCAPDAPRGRHGGRGRTGMRVFGLFDVLQGVQGADRPCAAGVCESTVKKQKGEGTPWDALVLFRLKGNSRKRF